MPAPDILVLGNIVKDITGDDWRPGGSVAYAAKQAVRLGLHVGAVTRCGPDVDPSAIVPEAEWHVVRAVTTTTFENRYVGGRREQRLPVIGETIIYDDIPAEWCDAPLILIAPVFHDVHPTLPARLKTPVNRVGIGAQGYLRRLVDDRVHPGLVEGVPAWLAGDAVFVSDEDVTDGEDVSHWRDRVPIIVLTRARDGCTVWHDGNRHDLLAIETPEVDPTGAGDAFAAAFLVGLSEGRDPVTAARFASAASALAIGAIGLKGIGDRAQIEALLGAATVQPS
jgi:hypothetical protein